MNETIKLILSLSLSGSILAVLIFAVKPFVRHRLSKSIQYYIWIVVLLRFIIPFSFEGSIMNDVFYSNKTPAVISSQETVKPLAGTSENIINSSILPSVRENVANGVYNGDIDHSRYFTDLFNQYALYLWMLGLIVALTANLTGYARFLKYLKQANKPATDEQNRILTSLLNGRYNVRLERNPFVGTPMLIGILKPYIIIPDINFDEKQLQNILLHEISHLRRFDIVLKWITMIAASIHWFNPLMYFVKKEINHACELACDEAVIKNLNPAEKQAYGDTLISVVAEHKYPLGVLQATMCEEKKSLKERLVAIMNHSKKSRLIVVISLCVLAAAVTGAVALGASVGNVNDKPPKIYISAEGLETKVALTGSYSWKYLGRSIQSDSEHPANFKYEFDNIVNTAAKQQIVIGTQKIKLDKKYDFTIDKISVYKKGQLVEFQSVEPSFMNGNLYLQAPGDAGEYIYCLILNFKDKGIVNYGFIVRVDMATYNLAEILKYKTPYIGDHVKVSAIVGRLPVPDSDFKQQYISMVTRNKPYKLNVFYEVKQVETGRTQWAIENPNNAAYSNLQKNALVTFCMIDNLDEVIFAFRNSQSGGSLDESKYGTSFTFLRTGFEERYGDLSLLGKNSNLLQDALIDNKIAAQTPENDQIEKYLEIIMSSPGISSSPQDYIKAHQKEYESIIKMGEGALNYILAQFQKGSTNNDLREHILMALGKDLLGDRDNVTDGSLSPRDWFSKLSLYEEIKLPDFKANVSESIEQLVYDAAVKQYSRPRDGFTVVAPTIFGSYEEGNKLKVFVTVFSNSYRMYGKTLSEVGGSVIPAAITYTKNADESYTVDKYLEAMDGSYFSKSIKEYCVMPVSKKK